MSAVFTPTRTKITVEIFRRLGEIDASERYKRVELIEGEMLDMAPIGSRHAWVVAALNKAFVTAAHDEAIVWVQNPVVLSDFSEPQPDLMLLRARPDGYRDALPTPADVLLLIEVADSSIAYDHAIKIPLYARHGISEVWLVDLGKACVEIYREPVGDAYSKRELVGPKGVSSPFAFPRVRIEWADYFG